MHVTVAMAQHRLPELLRAVARREAVVITEYGAPIAQLAPASPETAAGTGTERRVQLPLVPERGVPVGPFTNDEVLFG